MKSLIPVPMLVLGGLSVAVQLHANKVETKKMNILFITVEDWSAEAVGCYGNPIVKTPHIDALAKKGMMFNSAYCQGAVSNPSRASLTTGLRPETTGVFGNSDDTDNFITAEHPNIAKSLRQNGAWMAQTGKLMHKWFHSFNVINYFDQIEMEKPFFNENGVVVDLEPKRGPFNGVTKYTKIIPNLLPVGESRDWRWVPDKKHDAILTKLEKERDSILATGAESSWKIRAPFQQYHAEMFGNMGITEKYSGDGLVSLLGELMLADFAKEKKQFFLNVGLYAPHTPLLAPKPFVDMYDTAQINISTRTRDKDKGVPDIAVRNGNNYDIFNGYYPQFKATPERQKLAIQAYYATSSYVDAQIGRLIRSLETNGLSENTIVCVVADHGFHLGEHGCWSKFTVFEESNRVPFVLYVPGAKANGKKVDALVEMIDIFPTFCDLWEIEKDPRLEGLSFTPLLDNPKQKWKKAAFSMAPKPLNAHAVRTKRYRYAEYLPTEKLSDGKAPLTIELYDHKNDPDEQINLAGNPKYAKIEAEMKSMLYKGWKSALPK